MSSALLGAIDRIGARSREVAWQEALAPRPTELWDPKKFAEKQIQGLVHQLFSPKHARPVRQVVFSGGDATTDVDGLCKQVGETLAREKSDDVGVVGAFCPIVEEEHSDRREFERDIRGGALKESARQLRRNLWLLDAGECIHERGRGLHTCLSQLREEFAYSIVAAPPAGESDEATTMAQFSDGIILVLSAQHTRRIAARKIKQKIDEAQARLLGTVLCDREFPIPQSLYRRL
jgi:hypothetical protein